MIHKESLLLNASTTDDEERLNRLKEYDAQQGGVMLYRYRHLSDETPYEIDALRECKIWASNPNCFDDKYEFLPTNISAKDYECVRFFCESQLNDLPAKERKRILAEIDRIYHSNGTAFLRFFINQLKISRAEFAVSCFTENAPFDNNHNMWQQYAKNSGICLGYSLSTLIKNRVIIDPVYYVDSKDKSLGKMFEQFGKGIRTALCFCIKEKYGVDQFAHDSDVICWRDQREWRYAIPNTLDKSTNQYSNGCYLERRIVPDVVYVKNLKFKLRNQVWRTARMNGIPVKRIKI